ncbi:MAG: hypothetical protein K9N09_10305 [Candidatus Cloacimonetes bacterium]|nr:hypothetical protein [Candidatus Cloacimonadota bacterium]MCF7814603.1 hypothetical protein [Candidatus Cloacimonadota bacterium]MCF7869083.1 hypothetical protein [Candidatus Cloacimonadota bacterium]MCF7884500.1 hypothetical protein [Candidatus Cloacimonadota bacterium]
MKSISNIDGNTKVFEFLENTDKRIIIKLKYKKRKIDIWTSRFLDVFPQFEVRLTAFSNRPELPCDYWFHSLIENIDVHCSHCKEFQDGRDLSTNDTSCYKCFQRYTDFIEHFCNKCNQKPKKYNCSEELLKQLYFRLKSDNFTGHKHKAVIAYQVFCSFDKQENNKKFLNFPMFVLVLRFPDAKTVDSVVDQKKSIVEEMKNFISNWIEIETEVNEREIFEIALKIIALHYLFFYDLMSNTIFCNSPEYDPDKFIHGNSTFNAIEAFVLKQKGKSDSEIIKILNSKENDDKIIGLRQNNYPNQPELNYVELSKIMRRIEKIYNYPILEHIAYGELPESIKNLIDTLINDKKISKANVEIKDNSVIPGSEINQKVLDYTVIVNFIGLLESIKQTRFTNKLPALFEKDDLIKLYKEMTSNELDKDPCTLVQACRKLHLKYKTTHMAITEKLRYHPRYNDLKNDPDYPDPIYNNYNKINWFFENSDIEDIEGWIRKVEDLKK